MPVNVRKWGLCDYFRCWLPQSDTYHFATTSEITDLCKDHQWKPQPGGGCLLVNQISRDFHRWLASCKEEIRLYSGDMWLSPSNETALLMWDKQMPCAPDVSSTGYHISPVVGPCPQWLRFHLTKPLASLQLQDKREEHMGRSWGLQTPDWAPDGRKRWGGGNDCCNRKDETPQQGP